MSTAEKKSKKTLSKKLSDKVPASIPLKRAAVLKPELFTEVKNSKKTKDTSKKNEGLDADKKVKVNKTPAKLNLLEESEESKKGRVTRTKKYKEDMHNVNLEIFPLGKNPKTKVEPGESDSSTSSEIAKIKQEKEKDLTKTKVTAKTTTTAASKEVKDELEQSKWTPTNWQQMLENIRTMRSNDNAPVDTMGCHKCADPNADEKTQRFHKLVALMLSSQTKDETTYHAMLRLRENNLTPEVISEMKVNVLENILHPVSFYKNKAKYLQQTSKILIEKYSSDIPNNIKELVALPGVGPKMAHICMATAWHETTGIGVDVHVHRICNRLQWLPKPTKEPEQTRVALETWLPRDLWSEVNHLLVGFGQTTCTPLKPKCLECLNCNICPAAPKTKSAQEKRANAEVMNIVDKAKFKKSKMHI